jgi:hypothetical protein
VNFPHFKGHHLQYLYYPGLWLVDYTLKDNKTIEIVFLKNESRTMIILGRSLPHFKGSNRVSDHNVKQNSL